MNRRTRAQKKRAAKRRKQKQQKQQKKEGKKKKQSGWGQVRVDLTKILWLTMLAVGIEVLLWYLMKN